MRKKTTIFLLVSLFSVGLFCVTSIRSVSADDTLSVTLNVSPLSGLLTPGNYALLTASVSGTAQGTVHYQFDCNGDGNYEVDTMSNNTSYTATCTYNPNSGNYPAAVYVNRGNASQQSATVTVNTTTENIGQGSGGSGSGSSSGGSSNQITNSSNGYTLNLSIGSISDQSRNVLISQTNQNPVIVEPPTAYLDINVVSNITDSDNAFQSTWRNLNGDSLGECEFFNGSVTEASTGTNYPTDTGQQIQNGIQSNNYYPNTPNFPFASGNWRYGNNELVTDCWLGSASFGVAPAMENSVTVCIDPPGGGVCTPAAPIQGPIQPPPQPPALTITANPTGLSLGQSTKVSWTSSNTSSCVGASGNSYPTSGSFTDSPTASRSYTLTCTGNGSSVTKSVNVTVTSPPPIGYQDSTDNSSCTTSGWAYDPKSPSTSLTVHVYRDAPAGQGGTLLGGFTANVSRPDIVGAPGGIPAGSSPNHGFDINLSNYISDGQNHSLYVYAINTDVNGTNPLLNNSPKTIQCASPVTAQPLPQVGIEGE